MLNKLELLRNNRIIQWELLAERLTSGHLGKLNSSYFREIDKFFKHRLVNQTYSKLNISFLIKNIFQSSIKAINKYADIAFLVQKANRVLSWSVQLPGNLFVSFISLLLLFYGVVFLLASYFYFQYDQNYWKDRITKRTLSPIYSTKSEDGSEILLGALHNQKSNKREGNATYQLGFIPLDSETTVPPIYKAALLNSEDNGLRDNSPWYICGVNWRSLPYAWLSGRGGSTLPMQIVKNLEGWGQNENKFEKFIRKFKEIGAACQLYKHMISVPSEETTVDKIVRLYSGIHVIWTPDTGIRGIEAGARTTFDLPASKLNTLQQLLVASATASPFSTPKVFPQPLKKILLDANAEVDENIFVENSAFVQCKLIFPVKNNPNYRKRLEKAIVDSEREHQKVDTDRKFKHQEFWARKQQCRTFWRVGKTAKVLHDQGKITYTELNFILDEIDTLEKTGISPINPFEGLSDSQSVSLSSRSQKAVGEHALNLLREEAKNNDFEPGEPLRTELLFQDRLKQSMDIHEQEIDRDNKQTCIKLSKKTQNIDYKKRCDGLGNGHDAIVYAGVFDLYDGKLIQTYSNYELIFSRASRFSIGSLAKLPIAVAAIQRGLTPTTLLCPRAVIRYGRKLKRASKPREGYADCPGGKNSITLLDAMATSDNLAFYELALNLGDEAITRSLDSLGLSKAKDLAYALSFGAYETNLIETTRAAHRIFAIANQIKASDDAPHLLVRKNIKAKNVFLSNFSEEQSKFLKQLIDAPVQHPSGTMRRLQARGITGGKTGTTTSSAITALGANYTASKWSIFYDEIKKKGYVVLVTSGNASIPLAQPEIRGSAFSDIERTILALK